MIEITKNHWILRTNEAKIGELDMLYERGAKIRVDADKKMIHIWTGSWNNRAISFRLRQFRARFLHIIHLQ